MNNSDTPKPADSFTSNVNSLGTIRDCKRFTEARDLLESNIEAKTYNPFKEVLDNLED